MKLVFAVTCVVLLSCSAIRNSANTSLTGEYLIGSHFNKDGEKPGGSIEVLQYSEDNVVLSLFYCKGAPSYNFGSFMDTLSLKNSQAIYRSEYDSTCTRQFTFKPNGVTVVQQSTNWPAFCGFGWGVDASGFYTKTSKIMTEVKDPFEELKD